ncbi:MAG: DUF11 domain-containing protein [Acidobacteriota bacterium]
MQRQLLLTGLLLVLVPVLQTTSVSAATSADLSISVVSAPDPVPPGGTLTYTFTVTNDGPDESEDTEVDMILTPDQSLSSTAGCLFDPSGFPKCRLQTLSVGQSKQFDLVVVVAPGAAGAVGLQAEVSSESSSDPDPTDNTLKFSTTVGSPSADLRLEVLGTPNPVLPGGVATYTWTVTNDGPSAASDVDLSLTVPAGNLLTTTGCIQDPVGVPICDLETLASGASKQVSLEVTLAADARGRLELEGSVASAVSDPDSGNNSAEVSTVVSVEARVGAGGAPAIHAAPAEDRYTVVWQRTPEAGRGADDGIFARVYDRRGMPVGIELKLDQVAASPRIPDVSQPAAGEFVAVWQAEDSDGDGVFGRRFDAAGMPVGIEIQLSSTADRSQSLPAVAGTGDGFVVVWADEVGLGSFERALRRFDAAGMPVGIEQRFGAQDIEAKPPAVASAGDETLVAWEGATDGIAAQRFDALGMPVGIELQLSPGRTAARPATAPHPDGGFLVVWENGDGLDGEGKGIFGQRIDPLGMPVGIELQINRAATGDQGRPKIATSPDGRFVVTWEGPDADGLGIFARWLNPQGMPVGIELAMNMTAEGDQMGAEPAVIDDEGTVLVTWETEDIDRDGRPDVLTSPPNVIFADGFESGGFGAWSSIFD